MRIKNSLGYDFVIKAKNGVTRIKVDKNFLLPIENHISKCDLWHLIDQVDFKNHKSNTWSTVN